jgi:hypothetical protein
MRRLAEGLYCETYRERLIVLAKESGVWWASVDHLLLDDHADTRASVRRWAHEQIDREATTDG